MFSYEIIRWSTYLLAIASVIFFIRKENEVPLIYIFFFFSSGLQRYEVTTIDQSIGYVVVAGWDIFTMNAEIALEALNYFFIGVATFLVAYFIFYKDKPKSYIDSDSELTLMRYIQSHLPLVISIFVITSLLTVLRFGLYRISFSYGFFLPLGIGGGVVVLLLAVASLKDKKFGGLRVLMLGLALFMGKQSYNPFIRFSFLSWAACAAILFTGPMKKGLKLFTYFFGGAIALLTFTIAGVSRMTDISKLTFTELIETAVLRSTSSEDANMLDGFMMITQIYPSRAEYAYGINHLEIFVRPIPRSLWPNKPVGGWANKVGLNDDYAASNTFIGISESIFGTFYCEGGLVGVIGFSLIYVFAYIRLFTAANRYRSLFKYLIKGIVIAATIPLLRGGDIPGIVAFVGMSFWPVFIVQYSYGRFLKVESKILKRRKRLLAEKERLDQIAEQARKVALV
jgi:hypothetical protein